MTMMISTVNIFLTLLLLLFSLVVVSSNTNLHSQSSKNHENVTFRKRRAECLDSRLSSYELEFTSDRNSTWYRRTINIDNQRCVRYPSVIAYPSSTNQVSDTIRAARECGVLSYRIRSGGHGAAGYELSDENGLTIDMSMSFNHVRIDVETGIMNVGSGARFDDIYTALSRTTQDWIVVGGGCPAVACGGFYLGGGWSFLSRSYGLGIDTLLEITTVLANGTVIVSSKNEDKTCTGGCQDLWWASRGGGGGNFGVVTNFKVQLQRVIPSILIGQLCWAEDTDALSSIWKWLINSYEVMPDWIQVDPGWLPLGPNGTRLFCYTIVCNHNDEHACRKFVEPVVNRSDIVLNTLRMRSYLDWQLEHGSITSAQHGYLYLTNFVMPEGAVTPDMMIRLQRAILESPSYRNLVIFHMGGGQIAKVPNNATAFPHRDTQFVLQIKAIWKHDTKINQLQNMQWVQDLKTWLEPISTGSYVNYVDPFLNNFERMYYGDNLNRLRAIKSSIDPTSFFSFPQSIQPHNNNNLW